MNEIQKAKREASKAVVVDATDDPALAIIASRGTLAVWRHQGRPPIFYKVGNKVLYKGSDLNQWLSRHRVEPKTD